MKKYKVKVGFIQFETYFYVLKQTCVFKVLIQEEFQDHFLIKYLEQVNGEYLSDLYLNRYVSKSEIADIKEIEITAWQKFWFY